MKKAVVAGLLITWAAGAVETWKGTTAASDRQIEICRVPAGYRVISAAIWPALVFGAGSLQVMFGVNGVFDSVPVAAEHCGHER